MLKIDRFKKWCEHYIEVFGLRDFDIFYDYMSDEELEDYPHACALSERGYGFVKSATVKIRKDFKLTASEIRTAALHEILHVVLSQSTSLAFDRHATESQIRDSHESDVVRLTNAIKSLER